MAVFLACVTPAAVNRYPTVFSDTESYLVSALIFRPQFTRAFGYGAFLRATGGLWSLWLPIVAQSALTAWLVTRAVALDSPRWPRPWRWPAVLSLFAVVLLSHAPWLASWAQPDLFTGLMLLALFLLVEHRHDLPSTERLLLVGFLIGCVATHLTHPPLLLGLAAFAFACLLFAKARHAGRDLTRRLRRTAALAALAAVLGWGALGAANYITYRSFTASVGGPVFFFARLAADGDAAAALRPGCEAGKPWVACRFLDRFNMTADEFLWRGWSPLNEMGHASGFVGEAAELNPVLIRRIWPDWLEQSALRTLQQLGRLELGDGMDDEGTWMMGDGLRRRGLSHLVEAVAGTLQANDDLRALMPRLPVDTLAATGLVALLGLAVFGLVRGRPDLWYPSLLFSAVYVGNAALIALGGEVHDRYAARLVWLAPLLAGLLALRAASGEFQRFGDPVSPSRAR
ncbi:MAG: hypothetical protein ICV73_11205 [Acetobacteraceae bacterium]|nr:hypothetical protein [Acetobacteraceae bacterium]